MHRSVIPASEVAKKYPALFVRDSMDARVCIDITKDSLSNPSKFTNESR